MSILPGEPEISRPRICASAIGFLTISERLGSLFNFINVFILCVFECVFFSFLNYGKKMYEILKCEEQPKKQKNAT